MPEGTVQTQAEAVSWFETGLLREDDWHGCWIRADFSKEASVMIRSFSLDTLPKRARVYLCGLGYFELFVNGRPIQRMARLTTSSWTSRPSVTKTAL